MIRALVGGLGGALLVAGLIAAWAGWRGWGPSIMRIWRPSRARPLSTWDRWRWPTAAVAGLAAWALSRWPVAAVLVAAAVIGLPILLSTGSAAKARIARVEAIEDWTRRLSDVLTSGAGLNEALVSTTRSCPPAVRPEVDSLVARLAARWPVERALRAFGDDLHDPAGDLVVAALLLAAHRRGPGLASVLAGVAASVGEDVAARRRIEAERARPRTTAKAVTVITFAVLALGALTGTYLAPYGEPLGQIVLASLGAAFAACLLWMRRLTLPPAEARYLTGGAP